jgi:hypothetical protein
VNVTGKVWPVLEVVGDVAAVAAARVQEMDVVHFTDRFGLNLPSDLR